MATASSVTFQADKDTLFAAAIQIIQGAGYIISETDDAARKIVYYADKPGKFGDPAGRFETTITVSGASTSAATTAMLTIKTIGITMFDWGPVGGGKKLIENVQFENDLINFCKNELSKRYSIVATTVTNTNAPGTGGQQGGGCLVMFGLLGLLAAGGGLGCLMLLATLLP